MLASVLNAAVASKDRRVSASAFIDVILSPLQNSILHDGASDVLGQMSRLSRRKERPGERQRAGQCPDRRALGGRRPATDLVQSKRAVCRLMARRVGSLRCSDRSGVEGEADHATDVAQSTRLTRSCHRSGPLAALVSTQQVRPRPSALSGPVAGDAMATATHPAMRGSHSAISGNTMTRMSAMN